MAAAPQYDMDSVRDFVDGTVVTSWFLDAVRENPTSPALRRRDGDGWTELTWTQTADHVARVAGALRALGVGPGDRVLLMLRNRPEFHIVDLATTFLRAVPVSVYNSSAPEQLDYLARHSRAKVAVMDDPEFLSRLLVVRDGLPDLNHVVVVDVGADGAPGERSRGRTSTPPTPSTSTGSRQNSVQTTSSPSSTPAAPPATRRA